MTLVLCAGDGLVLGALPGFEAATPWWQDIAPVVDGARTRFGLDVVVLRLLSTARPSAHGGAVTYLAETSPASAATSPALLPWSGTLPDDPLRNGYARPGGPAADLAWADSVLADRGIERRGAARQIRTWNLSSLWTIPTSDGAAWLKVVPPFFGHEGAILERLGATGAPVPRLIGHDGPRLLLRGIPGDDRYDAPRPERLAMIDLLVDLQAEWHGRAAALLPLGLPDWRASGLTARIADVVERSGSTVSREDRETLGAFVDGLPARFAAVAACGLDDGLVHGDFHPGNLRGDGTRLTLLDWGDCGVGHPLLDRPAFLAQTAADARPAVRSYWDAAWRRVVPGSDPARAADLLAPVGAARQAVIYRMFLDRIEAAEHPYHQADVPDWLHRTAELVRGVSPVSHEPVAD